MEEVGCDRVRVVGCESWDKVLGEKEEQLLLVRLCSECWEVREPGGGERRGGERDRKGEEGGEGGNEGRERRGEGGREGRGRREGRDDRERRKEGRGRKDGISHVDMSIWLLQY